MRSFRFAVAFVLGIIAWPALAQNPGVTTQGTVTPNHAATFVDKFHIKDGGAFPSAPVGANPSATAGPAAVNGSAATFLRSDGAPAVQKGSNAQFGIMECDNVTLNCPGGVLSAVGVGANPTATAGPAAVNGSAVTFLRSDGAPAVQKGTNAQFGIVEGDGSTITCVAGVCSTVGSATVTCGAKGYVSACYNGSAWVAFKEDGTSLTVSVQDTCALQEVLNYAYGTSVAKNLSVLYFGLGQARPCSVAANTTITVPAQYGNSFYGFGLDFVWNNGAQDGLLFDTQRYGYFSCAGCLWHYTGTAQAIAIVPTLGPGNLACTSNATACWAIDYKYDLGTIFADGGPANAGLYIYVGAANGASQLLSSTFGDNIVNVNAIECQSHSNYGFQYPTGTNAFQAGGENQFNIIDIEGCIDAEMNLGSSGGSSNDVNIGTNIYTGNVGHTNSGSGQYAIITDVSADVFNLTSVNCYGTNTGQSNIFWGPNAANNVINTTQAIGCASLEAGTTQTFALNNYFSAAPWRTFTPTLTCSGGTVNTATAVGRARRVGGALNKSILYSLDLTLTTLTACSVAGGSQLLATIPWTQSSNSASVANGREIAASGLIYTGTLTAGNTAVAITGAANACTDCVSGRHIVMSGTSEAQ